MPTIEIYRVRIDPANVERLLEIRAVAVAEFQEQVPELLAADLVRLGGDVWLSTSCAGASPSPPSASKRPQRARRRAPRCTA